MFDDKYFANSVWRLHINSAIILPFNILAIYLILSTKSIGNYKFYLLNIVIWSFLLDLYLTLIFSPVPIFPAAGICSESIFNFFHAGFHMIVFAYLSGGIAASVISAFVYRYFCISNQIKKLHSRTGLIFLIFGHLIAGLPLGICFYMALITNENVNELKNVSFLNFK